MRWCLEKGAAEIGSGSGTSRRSRTPKELQTRKAILFRCSHAKLHFSAQLPSCDSHVKTMLANADTAANTNSKAHALRETKIPKYSVQNTEPTWHA